jgi:predicted aminopeptidase
MRVLPQSLLSLTLVCLLSGCESLRYYSHVAGGQLALLSGRQSVEQLIHSDHTSPHLKEQLQQAQAIRQFAIDDIGLPDSGSYLSYQDIGRSAVVWNVFAAKPFQVKAKQWCFPVIACVSYKGYFEHRYALNYAAQLQEQGYETYVAAIPAYSTLGWFDDPLLSTFIHWQDWRLAALMFHEMAHQQFYLAGDTKFSESFASAVEHVAVREWLLEQDRPEAITDYERYKAVHQAFTRSVLQLRKQLDRLYQLPLSDLNKRLKKQQIMEAYHRRDYPEFKAQWQTDRYDQWVNKGLNNAKLSTISSYFQWQPFFIKLFQQSKQDWRLFFERVGELADLPKEQRDAYISRLQ